eukprot:2406027-Amphidinium_carterae.2
MTLNCPGACSPCPCPPPFGGVSPAALSLPASSFLLPCSPTLSHEQVRTLHPVHTFTLPLAFTHLGLAHWSHTTTHFQNKGARYGGMRASRVCQPSKA